MIRKTTNSIHIEKVVDDENLIAFPRLEAMVKCILSSENQPAKWTINIVFVNDEYITKLNKRFLGKKNATDVLSFNLSEADEMLGEVYISAERAKIQATEYQVSFQNEVSRLVAHGVYHLLGYDDQTESERQVMTAKENNALQH
ncbi:MAG: rRNA maturation RNase YbeY [Calditrichaeota bacterium]|nr:rRNA maturation RNase YbeY [Calditrichota bacterium]